jgi:hypothetical protein
MLVMTRASRGPAAAKPQPIESSQSSFPPADFSQFLSSAQANTPSAFIFHISRAEIEHHMRLFAYLAAWAILPSQNKGLAELELLRWKHARFRAPLRGIEFEETPFNARAS